MSSLESLEAKWISLFDELRCDPQLKDQISGPFLSAPATDARSILYVGKATFGNFYRDDSASAKLTIEEKIRERHEVTRHFIKEEAPHYPGGFWPFARELNTALANRWKSPAGGPLQHITWTNICKIGALNGNPSGVLFEKQRNLAADTLREEISSYHPLLICFVTWGYEWDFVKEVVDQPKDESWDKTRNEDYMWSRPATGALPGILLTGHPERKPSELRQKWVTRSLELLDETERTRSAVSSA
jgi:hypothetical protein